jgi:hypothetical protein
MIFMDHKVSILTATLSPEEAWGRLRPKAPTPLVALILGLDGLPPSTASRAAAGGIYRQFTSAPLRCHVRHLWFEWWG